MLTRRQIRIKVMQHVYAHYNGNQISLRESVKQYQASCYDMKMLYLTLLGLLKSVWDYADEQATIQKKKRRSDAPLNPHFDEIVALEPLRLIAQHPYLKQQLTDLKISIWELEFNFVRQLFEQIIASGSYEAYQKAETKSFKQQQKLLITLFKNVVAPNEQLYLYIEDLSMQWVDDLPVVNTYLLKQLRKLKSENLSSLGFPNNAERIDDIAFGKQLMEKVLTNEEELQKEFEGKTPNWDPERIAQLDSMLIKIAIAELIYFENIPTKVTMNEYLEIAKEYSTPKSNQFINGVLDSLVREYKENNRLHKKGRGLIE